MKSESTLDKIINPEIIGDSFYNLLFDLAQKPEVKNILEIGSSSGAGSTHAFVEAISKRTDSSLVNLFCMEVSLSRFSILREKYLNFPFVKPYNLSSISTNEFPTSEDIIHFYNSTRTNLNNFPLDTVLDWLDQDIKYVSKNVKDCNGIRKILYENNLKKFDLVLIDGSEFTGEIELYSVIGSNYIALDDINAYKCFNCYNILRNHVAYTLINQDINLRNGYAIFKRRY